MLLVMLSLLPFIDVVLVMLPFMGAMQLFMQPVLSDLAAALPLMLSPASALAHSASAHPHSACSYPDRASVHGCSAVVDAANLQKKTKRKAADYFLSFAFSFFLSQ